MNSLSYTEIAALAISLITPLLFLGLIRSRVKEHSTSEPYLALISFAAGMVMGAIAFFWFQLIGNIPGLKGLNNPIKIDIVERMVLSFTIIAPWEEMFKALPAVALYTYKNKLNNIGQFRPVDGIVYTVASGLGFSAMENWYAMYSIGSIDPGRILLIPFVHMLLSGIVGRGLATSIEKKGYWLPLAAALFEASLVHGFYDYIEMIGGLLHLVLLPILFVFYYLLSEDLHKMGSLRPKPPVLSRRQ